MKGLKFLFIVSLFIACPFSLFAQQEIGCVKSFGDNLHSWCGSGNISYLQQLESLVSGRLACRVDDGIMAEFRSVDPSVSLTSGTSTIDTYFTQFQKKINEGNIRYSHGEPVIRTDIQSPGSFDLEDYNVKIVDMSVDVSGSINFSGKDLFYVVDGHIAKIIDNSDGLSLGAGLRAYSARNFDEAFRIFRQLAFADYNNLEAQYYTAMMEKMRQGCLSMNSEFRRMESDILLAKIYYKSTSIAQKRGMRGFIAPETFLFAIGQRPSVNGITFKMDYQGNNSYLYGFIDEQGNTILPCIYSDVRMFNSDGFACVSEASSNLWGVIDKHGKWIISPKYKYILPSFYNGHTVALCPEGYSEIINTDGAHVAYIRGSFVPNYATEKYVYVRTVLEDGTHYYLYDYDGNKVDEMTDRYEELSGHAQFTSTSGTKYIVKRIW